MKTWSIDRMELLLTLGAVLVLVSAHFGTARSVPIAFADAPCGGSGVEVLGYSDALNKTEHGGLPVSELSGLTYDPVRDVFYAVADRSGTVPAHFFTFKVPTGPAWIGAPVVENVTLLRRPDRTPFTGADFDGEGLVMNGPRELLVVSEGGASPPLPGPTIRRFSMDGEFRSELPTPPRYFVAPSGEGTGNLTWESLTLSPSGMSLFTANEAPLSGDGQTGDLRSRIRIQRYVQLDAGSFRRAEQYFYLSDPGRSATDIGISDMLALSNTELLVMERGFKAAEGNTVRIYRVSTVGAADVTERASLAEAGVAPLQKELFVDLATCPPGDARIAPGSSQANPLLDNFEAMTFGPVLGRNQRTLVLLSDDNGATNQTTRLLVLTLPVPTHVDSGPACALFSSHVKEERPPCGEMTPGEATCALLQATKSLLVSGSEMDALLSSARVYGCKGAQRSWSLLEWPLPRASEVEMLAISGCRFDDPALCRIALELENALKDGDIDYIIRNAVPGDCDYPSSEPSNCIQLAFNGFTSGGYLYGEGAAISPEAFEFNLHRWMELASGVRVGWLGLAASGAPAVLLVDLNPKASEELLARYLAVGLVKAEDGYRFTVITTLSGKVFVETEWRDRLPTWMHWPR